MKGRRKEKGQMESVEQDGGNNGREMKMRRAVRVGKKEAKRKQKREQEEGTRGTL